MPWLDRLPPWLPRLVPVVGTLGALALAAWLLDLPTLRASWNRLPGTALLACAALCLITHVLIAVRWALIVAGPGASPSVHEMLVSLHASLFNLITPAAIGADAHRIATGSGRIGGRSGSAGLVMVERLLGIAAQATVYVVAYVAAIATADAATSQLPAFAGVAAILFAAAAIGIAGCLVWLLPWARVHLEEATWPGAARLAVMASANRSTPRRMAVLGALSLAAVTAWIVAAVPLAAGSGLTSSLAALAIAVILTEFARLLPISVQGIGVREVTFSVLIAQMGGDAAAGFLVCAVLYLVNYIVIGAAGFAAWLVLQRSGAGIPAPPTEQNAT